MTAYLDHGLPEYERRYLLLDVRDEDDFDQVSNTCFDGGGWIIRRNKGKRGFFVWGVCLDRALGGLLCRRCSG